MHPADGKGKGGLALFKHPVCWTQNDSKAKPLSCLKSDQHVGSMIWAYKSSLPSGFAKSVDEKTDVRLTDAAEKEASRAQTHCRQKHSTYAGLPQRQTCLTHSLSPAGPKTQ